MIRTSLFALMLLAALPVNADVDIYRCVDVDENVAYQQTPCPVVQEKVEKVEKVEPDEVIEEAPVPSSHTAEEAEACKDPLRDAIDQIEAEMLRGFSPEEGEEYRVKLRTLTEKMRACG